MINRIVDFSVNNKFASFALVAAACVAEVSQVKAEKAGRKISYRGKTYYFDSDGCKDQFQKIPGKFLKETAEGTPAEKAPSPKVPAKQQGHGHS